MTDLTGKTAIIVGASGEHNFGVAMAKLFAEKGANVIVSARRREPLEKLAAEIGGTAVPCDISDDAQLGALAKAAVDTYGGLDIAVNSAGILAGAPISELTPETIRPTMDISFMGALLFFKHMGNTMAEHGGGSVITVSSLTARIPGPNLSVYSGCRAGIDYGLRVAALEYGPQKVRFNSLAAGLIRTDLNDMMFEDPATVPLFENATPLRRMGTVDDMAQAALWLADDKASGFVTGQIIDISGGMQSGELPRRQEAMRA